MSKLRPQKKVEYVTASGVRLYITPLGAATLQALYKKALELHPAPDRAEYEVAVESSVNPDLRIIPPENEPAYLEALEKAQAQQSRYVDRAIRELCISYPDFPGGLPEVVEALRPRLERLGEFIDLNGDVTEDVFNHIIMASGEDVLEVRDIAYDEVPLTEVELGESERLFRPAIPRETRRLVAAARTSAYRLAKSKSGDG